MTLYTAQCMQYIHNPLFVCVFHLRWFVEILLVCCLSCRYFSVTSTASLSLSPFRPLPLTHTHTQTHTLSLARGNCDCFQDRSFPVHYYFYRVCVPWSRTYNWNASPNHSVHRPVDSLLPIGIVTHADCCVNIKLTWWQFKRNMAWHNWHQYYTVSMGSFANVFHFPVHFRITKPYTSSNNTNLVSHIYSRLLYAWPVSS